MKKKSIKITKQKVKGMPSKTKKTRIRPKIKKTPGTSARSDKTVYPSVSFTFRKSELLKSLADHVSRLDESRLEHLLEYTHILLHNMKIEEAAKKKALETGAARHVK